MSKEKEAYRLTVKEMIEELSQYEPDAQVWVTTVDNHSYLNIEVSADTEPDMGNDVYITGWD